MLSAQGLQDPTGSKSSSSFQHWLLGRAPLTFCRGRWFLRSILGRRVLCCALRLVGTPELVDLTDKGPQFMKFKVKELGKNAI